MLAKWLIRIHLNSKSLSDFKMIYPKLIIITNRIGIQRKNKKEHKTKPLLQLNISKEHILQNSRFPSHSEVWICFF